jgi:hypothetical protein
MATQRWISISRDVCYDFMEGFLDHNGGDLAQEIVVTTHYDLGGRHCFHQRVYQ